MDFRFTSKELSAVKRKSPCRFSRVEKNNGSLWAAPGGQNVDDIDEVSAHAAKLWASPDLDRVALGQQLRRSQAQAVDPELVLPRLEEVLLRALFGIVAKQSNW